MKVNQISEILNDVYSEVIGETELIAEDLSNIVDVGKTITGDSKFGADFENYAGKIVDKVGKVVFHDDFYTAKNLGIMKDSWEFASILEKVRCEVSDYRDNNTWKLLENGSPREYTSDDVIDMYSFEPATVNAKYYNKRLTFEQKISLTEKQLKSAFQSASDMMRFISSIENRIRMKLEMAKESLEYRAVINLLAEKLSGGNQIINLAELWYEASGIDSDVKTLMTNKEFLRFCAKTLGIYKSLIQSPSMMYGDGGFVNVTNPAQTKIIFLTDFAKAIETELYSDTYNKEFVSVGNFAEIPYWQGRGTDDGMGDRSTISAVPATVGGETNVITQSGIVALLFDERACSACNEQQDVVAIPNLRDHFTNYFYQFEGSYINDTNENVIVFVISDYIFDGTVSYKNVAPTSWSTLYTNYVTDLDGTPATSTYDTTGKTAYYKKTVHPEE